MRRRQGNHPAGRILILELNVGGSRAEGRGEDQKAILIGVISDTHGLLRPEAINALRGAEHIIHPGDVGDREILEQLSAIAPVTAVRGNADKGAWSRKLPETHVLELGGISIYILHDLAQLDLKPEAAGFSVVISGHTHVPKQETRDGVLYFNPGSAGPRRFKLPVSVGRLVLERGAVRSEILQVHLATATAEF